MRDFPWSVQSVSGLRGDGLMPLRLRDVSVTLGGRRVLDRVTLDLNGPGLSVIMGPNGAGKSLLLQVLHGLRRPDAGSTDWNGVPPEQATRRQALVFQKPVLLRRSVAANLDFVLRARGKDRALGQALLAHVGLLDKAATPARRLSGGEAQKLALARALATEPEVLLLDEPTASLDPAATQDLENLVRQAVATGTRVLCVTHDIGQARRLADDVVFLHAGRVAEHAPAQRFFDAPQSAAAQAYLAGRIPI